MNIKMQCCGLIMLAVIMFIYTRQKKINLNTEKAFMRLMIVVAIGLTLDICSIFALNYHAVLPVIVVDLFCKSYVSSLVLVALSGLLYILVDIHNLGSKFRAQARVFSIITLVAILLIFVLPIKKEVSDLSRVYTYGPSVWVTYVTCFVYIAILIFLMIQQRKKMNPKRRSAVMIWAVLWLGSAVVQFIDNRILLVGFAGAVGVMVIYLILENPDTNCDRDTGLFNETAFMQYIKQMYSKNEEFSMIALVFPQIYELRSSEDYVRGFKINVIDYISSLPEVYAFQCAEDELVLVLKSDADIDTIEAMLRSRFVFGWGKSQDAVLKPSYILMPSSSIIHQAEDLLPAMRYARQKHNEFSDNDRLELNEDIVNCMYEEQQIEHLIADALKNDWVEVYYQPIYSTKDKKFTSAEALCRIFTEEGTMIPPNDFIGIAEDNGMILKLGECVFEKVCQFLQTGEPQRLGMDYIEVNLSVVQCSHEMLPQRFIEIMEEYEVDPAHINLEITETGSIATGKIMMENMRKLIDYGVQFSLDDFGTGHSNLNYIVDMPVNIVKFDRSMTASYFKNGKAKYVMDAAMHMIHGMELQIVSEGIETKEQLQTMEDLYISYIQGYYFSKPLPKDDFLEFIKKQQGNVNKA